MDTTNVTCTPCFVSDTLLRCVAVPRLTTVYRVFVAASGQLGAPGRYQYTASIAIADVTVNSQSAGLSTVGNELTVVKGSWLATISNFVCWEYTKSKVDVRRNRCQWR